MYKFVTEIKNKLPLMSKMLLSNTRDFTFFEFITVYDLFAASAQLASGSICVPAVV